MPNRWTLPLGRLAIFLFLSCADLYLTVWLIECSNGRVAEGNPIARAWYMKYGAQGLVIFKVAIMALVGGIGVVISLYRPETGKRILTFACLAVGVVVVYSYKLLMKIL
jgi:Domain of unknown function (DUF5658)